MVVHWSAIGEVECARWRESLLMLCYLGAVFGFGLGIAFPLLELALRIHCICLPVNASSLVELGGEGAVDCNT